MKPLGLKPFHHKTDHRLHENNRKVPNWWEAEQEPNKALAKREAKKEITDELDTDRTDAEIDFDHEQGCPDCNGHDITDFYEYQERISQA